MTKAEFLNMWAEELEDCESVYKEAMQQKPHAKENHDHILRDRLGSRLYLYGDELPKDQKERLAIEQEAIDMLLEKARDLGIEVPFDEMAGYIKKDSKNIRYIDVLTKNADKDDLLTMVAKENPEVLRFLSEEQFDLVRKEYEDSIVKFNQMSTDNLNRHLLSRDHQKYVDGHPSYIIQLIKNTPELANAPMIKAIVEREPELEKEIKIIQLGSEKQKLESELKDVQDEIARYNERDDKSI